MSDDANGETDSERGPDVAQEESISMEGLTVPDRVHVVPLGHEFERVIVPARRIGADRVYLVTHEADDPDEQPSYYEDIYDELTEAGIDIDDSHSCDIFDLYDTLGTIAALVDRNREHEMYVNLASGTKVTAIAGMIACMVTGDAEPIYVHASEHGHGTDRPVAENVTGISRLPRYPIQAPSNNSLELLAFIAEEGPVTKQACIEFAITAGLDPLAEHDADDTRGLYRLLDSHLLNPLREDGYVETHKQGRTKLVEATEEGRNTLEGFAYMLKER